MKNWFIILLFLLSSLSASAQLGDGEKRLIGGISNPKNVEFSPTISADGRTIIFETQNKDKWELYQSNLLDDGSWSKPEPLTAINQKCEFLAGPSLSYDGNTLYYTAFIVNQTTSEDIFYSTRLQNNQWSEPKNIGPVINTTDSYEGFPSVTSDGNAMYFIRVNEDNPFDKKSKEACFKIFVSQKQEDGTWGEATALPETINAGCERDPRIMADNHTLIFSSIRPEGKGKYDLYQSRLLSDGNWATPVTLDFVNSVENDQSPCISAAGKTMFYYTDNDIYEIGIPETYRQMINITLIGKVLNEKQNLPLSAEITIHNTKSGEKFSTKSNESDGKFSIVLAAGAAYEITFEHPGFLTETLSYDYTNQKAYVEVRQDVMLSSTYSIQFSSIDKDLKYPVSSFLTIKDSKQNIIISDSIRKSTFPKTIALQATETYTMSVAAPSYPAVQLQLTKKDKKRENALPVSLETEKVQYTAVVTDITTGEKKRMKVTYNNTTKDEVIIGQSGEVVYLRKGDRYQVMTTSEKGLMYVIQDIVAGEGETTINLTVAAIKEGAKLSLNYVYFQSNSSALSPASELELNNIVSMLQQNPNVIIEIAAHTDDIGSDEYNNKLSAQRAQSVITLLTKKGIPPKQLSAKGYGKKQPVVPNDSDENRAKNRRVELVILKAA